MARRQLELDNTVAAELAGAEDALLRDVEDRIGASLYLRGNVLTLDGSDAAVAEAERAVSGILEALESGHEASPATVETVERAVRADRDPGAMLDDVVWSHRGTRISARTANQQTYIRSIRSNGVTFGIGPAGTGKTFLAVAMAVSALTSGDVNRIILTRPAVEAGERLGFLPGDLQAKVDPFLRPLFDALYDMLDPEKVTGYLERGVIEIAPLAFMRGRTLNDSFVILDEAQNTSGPQMQMFLTRLGFNSKMVVTGDITQTDLPAGQRSGLHVVGSILDEVDGVTFVRFGGQDVVRHALVQRIVAAYDAHSTPDSGGQPDGSPGSEGR
ncbi:MAG: PhoH family protein [Solirubrobacterales bacterium]